MMKRRTMMDLVSVMLGEDSTRTIRLLSGLRPGQARVVVQMGELRRFPPGAEIIKSCAQGSEMFVIVNGAAEVWLGNGPDRQQVAELHRGEVFGEMALVRQ